MSDKRRQIAVLLNSLSRIPGLGFLSQAEYRFQEGVQAVDGVIDDVNDHKEYLENARDAGAELATFEGEGQASEEEEEEDEEEE